MYSVTERALNTLDPELCSSILLRRLYMHTLAIPGDDANEERVSLELRVFKVARAGTCRCTSSGRKVRDSHEKHYLVLVIYLYI